MVAMQWFSMVLNGLQWLSMVLSGYQCFSMVTSGSQWFPCNGYQLDNLEVLAVIGNY